MDSSLIPNGWKVTHESTLPRNNPSFREFFQSTPRITESDIPNLKKFSQEKKNLLTKTIQLKTNIRVFYIGQTINNQVTGLGIQRIVDQSGTDQIYEGLFVDGILEWGRWWWADDDVTYHHEGSFILGKPDGYGVETDSNGETSKGEYQKGKKIGTWKFINIDNILTDEGMLVYGQRQGHWKTFYSNGFVQSDGKYEDGQMVDLWTTYHENGKLSSQGTYQNERRDGLWQFYGKTGQLEKKIEYCQGHQLS